MKIKLSLMCDYTTDENNPEFGIIFKTGRQRFYLECIDRECAVELLEKIRENAVLV
jgi:hypothetical protein